MSCTHDCSSCQENCSERKEQEDFSIKLNNLSSVKKYIGVVSGKGGVGKSIVTSALAVLMQRRGYKVGILDADITGPSIPKAFGIKENAKGNEFGIIPQESKTGIDIMSVNLLLENDTDPVVWRGPVIAGTVKQFFTDVIWKDIDYMFIDMPPGTGDVPLTVFQSVPLDGIIVVTSPQDLVSMIVKKAINMAKLMNIPVLGIVENYSYFECDQCKKQHKIFGESHIEEIAEENDTQVLAKVPVSSDLAKCVDTGTIELFVGDYFENAADVIEKELKI